MRSFLPPILTAALTITLLSCAPDPTPGGHGGPREQPHVTRVVLAIAEPEYKTMETLPLFAERELHGPLGFEVDVVGEHPADAKRLSHLPDALERADVLILSIRRRAMTSEEMAALRKYLAAGKPLIGVRTANHAFAPREPVAKGFEKWDAFDAEVFGGHYHGHHGVGPVASVTAAEGVADHPILRGVQTPFESRGSLYQVSPLREGVHPLLMGKIDGQPAEPVAWTTTLGRSRVFYTSLGHAEDFNNPHFTRMLRNAVLWAIDHEGESSRH